MGGLDELVDNVDEEKELEEAQNILDELDIDDQEELKELEDRLDRVQDGLLHYDKRMEELEERMDIFEGAIVQILKSLPDVPNTTEEANNDVNKQQQSQTEEQSAAWNETGSDNGDEFDW